MIEKLKLYITCNTVCPACLTVPFLPAGFLSSLLCSACLTHLSALLGTGGCAAGAAGCGSQQPTAAQQAQPGTRQAPGGHLELTEAPPGRHAAPNTASGGERVRLAEPAAAGRDKEMQVNIH